MNKLVLESCDRDLWIEISKALKDHVIRNRSNSEEVYDTLRRISKNIDVMTCCEDDPYQKFTLWLL